MLLVVLFFSGYHPLSNLHPYSRLHFHSCEQLGTLAKPELLLTGSILSPGNLDELLDVADFLRLTERGAESACHSRRLSMTRCAYHSESLEGR